jgi:phycocyanobilin:ferredoxin oxidoreductase
MNALAAMAEAAGRFRARLLAVPGSLARPLAAPAPPLPGLEWSNLLLAAPSFRHGHVESFVAPGRVSVLHVCLFPPLDDPAPIYGFDMVAGPARVTGIFLDFSPVVEATPGLRLADAVDPARLAGFAAPRPLPPWGEVFSADMLAVRPADSAEVARAIALAEAALQGWLARPGRSAGPGAASRIAAGQARYVAAQRRNEHTLRMLAGFIGAEAARRFIDDVLFPAVATPAAVPSRAA